MNRDKEIWGMALWVEKNHGDAGHSYIEDKIAKLEAHSEAQGVELWRQVAKRFTELRTGPIPIYGQPETWPH